MQEIDPTAIYIALTCRPSPNEYHWLIYAAGTFFHANNDTGTWHYQEKPWTATYAQNLAVLLSIGTLKDGLTTGRLGDLLSQISMSTPADDGQVRFTCRIWVRAAVRTLMNRHFIDCASIDEVQSEALHYANKRRAEVERGTGKSGVYRSNFSA